jgi:hypothetical protein
MLSVRIFMRSTIKRYPILTQYQPLCSICLDRILLSANSRKKGSKRAISDRCFNVFLATSVLESTAGKGGGDEIPRYVSKILLDVLWNVRGDGLGSPFLEASGSIEIIHCPNMPFIAVFFDSLDKGSRNVTV